MAFVGIKYIGLGIIRCHLRSSSSSPKHSSASEYTSIFMYHWPHSVVLVAKQGFCHCRVPTLTGFKELSIGRGTQPGDRLRMKGAGMPILGSYAKGDQFVHVNVTLPRSTTQRQRELLIEFQNEGEAKAKTA